MSNPFEELKKQHDLKEQDKPTLEERKLFEEQRQEKRDAIYNTYTPMVNEVLDQLIEAYRPGVWEKGSDCVHTYCCHIQWFVGPRETFKAAYDEHHDIRRRIEVILEQDGMCNPVGFKVINHESITKSVHAGLSRDELIRGIKSILA